MSGMSEVSVKAMLEDLVMEADMGALRHSQDFVKDLMKYFKEHGALTEKQESALRRIYRSHMGE